MEKAGNRWAAEAQPGPVGEFTPLPRRCPSATQLLWRSSETPYTFTACVAVRGRLAPLTHPKRVGAARPLSSLLTAITNVLNRIHGADEVGRPR